CSTRHCSFQHRNRHLSCMPGDLHFIFILDHAHTIYVRTDVGDFFAAGFSGYEIPYDTRHAGIVDPDISARMLFEKVTERYSPLTVQSIGPRYDIVDRCLFQCHLLLHQRRDENRLTVPCHEEQFRTPPFDSECPVIPRQIIDVSRVGEDDERIYLFFHCSEQLSSTLSEIHHTYSSLIT